MGATARVRMTPRGPAPPARRHRAAQVRRAPGAGALARRGGGRGRGLARAALPLLPDQDRLPPGGRRGRAAAGGAQRLAGCRGRRRGRRPPGRRAVPRPGGPAARVVRRARARPGADRPGRRRRPRRDGARARGRGGGARRRTCRMPRSRPCTAGSPTSRTGRCSGPRCRQPSGMPAGSPWSTTAPERSPSSPRPSWVLNRLPGQPPSTRLASGVHRRQGPGAAPVSGRPAKARP